MLHQGILTLINPSELFLLKYPNKKRLKQKPSAQVTVVAKAAPVAENFGINKKFNVTLIRPRIKAVAVIA
jgi:hypothetical protein